MEDHGVLQAVGATLLELADNGADGGGGLRGEALEPVLVLVADLPEPRLDFFLLISKII
jgi:hypothetical protein